MYFDKVVFPMSKYIQDEIDRRGLRLTNTITTNGVLMNDRTISRFNEINLNGFQITLDGYKEAHDKVRFSRNGNGSCDVIISNINKICSSVENANISLRVFTI